MNEYNTRSSSSRINKTPRSSSITARHGEHRRNAQAEITDATKEQGSATQQEGNTAKHWTTAHNTGAIEQPPHTAMQGPRDRPPFCLVSCSLLPRRHTPREPEQRRRHDDVTDRTKERATPRRPATDGTRRRQQSPEHHPRPNRPRGSQTSDSSHTDHKATSETAARTHDQKPTRLTTRSAPPTHDVDNDSAAAHTRTQTTCKKRRVTTLKPERGPHPAELNQRP